MILGTWLFHQFFDSLNTTNCTGDDVPQIALKPSDSNSNDELVNNLGIKRKRVNIFVECREIKKLKLGSTKLSQTQLETFVHVVNPETFCDCLKWKYEDTNTKWEQADSN